MAHVVPKFEGGPHTFDVGVDTVIGGRLVEVKSDGTIKHATAASIKVVGVALDDAKPLAGQATDGTTVTAAIIRSQTAVANGCIVRVEYSAAANFGDRLVTDTDGKVKPYTPGTSTFDQIVGRCWQTGITVAMRALAYIDIV